MPQSTIIPYLFLATFAIVIVYGIMQFFKARKAKAEGHTSAQARQSGEPAGAKTIASGISENSGPSSGTSGTAKAAEPTPPIVPR